MSSIAVNNIGSISGGATTSGTDTPNPVLDTIMEMVDLCWNETDPKFNICGNSANLKITGSVSEVDNKIGDARVRLKIERTFTPTNVATDTLTTTYRLPTGQQVVVTNQSNNFEMLDLYGNETFDLAANGMNISSIIAINKTNTVKTIKVLGNLNLTAIQSFSGAFFMFKKLQNIQQGGLQYNIKEIVFFDAACSNFIQGNGFISFDYDMAFTTTSLETMFWVDQTVYRLNNNFFSQNSNLWDQIVRINLQQIIPPIDFIREIVFTNDCATKTIRKRVYFKNARTLFQPVLGFVNKPIELKITDF